MYLEKQKQKHFLPISPVFLFCFVLFSLQTALLPPSLFPLPLFLLQATLDHFSDVMGGVRLGSKECSLFSPLVVSHHAL